MCSNTRRANIAPRSRPRATSGKDLGGSDPSRTTEYPAHCSTEYPVPDVAVITLTSMSQRANAFDSSSTWTPWPELDTVAREGRSKPLDDHDHARGADRARGGPRKPCIFNGRTHVEVLAELGVAQNPDTEDSLHQQNQPRPCTQTTVHPSAAGSRSGCRVEGRPIHTLHPIDRISASGHPRDDKSRHLL